MWSDPFWGKPFGELSEAREQKAVIGTEWENLSVPKLMPLRKPVDLFSVFKRTASGALSTMPAWGNCRQPVVKLKKYAHERLVLSSYLEAPAYRGRKISLDNLKRGLSLRSKLDIPRETRRGIKIGGRFRNQPLKTKFSTTGKNMVRDGAYISEHQTEGKGIFLTLTYPGGTHEGFQVLAIASGYCVDRVNRWLRYRVGGGVFSYVWELQKRGAPHLHYIFRLPSSVDVGAFQAEIRQRWYQILCDVSEDSQVDLFERKQGGTWLDKPDVLQVDVRPIHETYAKYMAKYMSKTASKAGKKSKWYPGRWWGVSAAARKLIYAARLEVVFPVKSAPGSYGYIKQFVNTLGDLVQDAKSFARIPNGEEDAISVQPIVGCGTDIFLALQQALVWGDFTPALELLERSRDWAFMGPHVWRINYHDCA